MAKVSKQTLYSFFQTGDTPTQAQFASLIMSMINIIDDQALLGLREYDATRSYQQNESVIYNNTIYQALASTTGEFDPTAWKKIAGSTPGSPVYKGSWDADKNKPDLTKASVKAGDYYIVSVDGDTNLSGITDWVVGDWAIHNGKDWEKISGTNFVTDAENVGKSGADLFKQKSTTILQFKKIQVSDGSLFVAVDEENNFIDLGIQFDDTGTDPNRAWSAEKISEELLKKVNRPPFATLLNFALFDSDGNIIDNNVNSQSFMPAGAKAADIPVQEDGHNVSGNVQVSLQNIDSSLIDTGQNLDDHLNDTENPHEVTKEQVNLGNVTNDQQLSLKQTAEMEKEIVTDSKVVNALTMNYTPSERANYFIEWYFEIGKTGTSVISANVTVSLDGRIIGQANPRISANSGARSFSGFALRDLVTAEHKITVDFSRTDGKDSNAAINNVRLRVVKS